jgi:hypothetical protein
MADKATRFLIAKREHDIGAEGGVNQALVAIGKSALAVNQGTVLSPRSPLRRARSTPRRGEPGGLRDLRERGAESRRRGAGGGKARENWPFYDEARSLPTGAPVNHQAHPSWWATLIGSSGWTRTNDQSVNSRPLYRLSYAGMWDGKGSRSGPFVKGNH